MAKNTSVILASRPTGKASADNFIVRNEPIPELEEGQILIKTEYVSLDPTLRTWMNEVSYIKGNDLDRPMMCFSAGYVTQSRNEEIKEGTYVFGILRVQEYVVHTGAGLTICDTSKGPNSWHLGVLGMPGMTAYFGLLEKGKPQKGETVLVVGAAGIVGSTVGQIAKIKGCKVGGTAGTDEKCRFLIEECGFDFAINYKTEDVEQALIDHCPDGIDIVYDNVGGDLLDAAMTRLAQGARVTICGAISQYYKDKFVGPSNYMKIVSARGIINGIIVFDYIPRYPEAVEQLSQWLIVGQMKTKEHFIEGIENFPEGINMLYNGKNFGKLILKI